MQANPRSDLTFKDPTMKLKQIYVCQQCGSQSPKWAGQCTDCNSWNSLIEDVIATGKNPTDSRVGFAGVEASSVITLEEVPLQAETRVDTGLAELNRVLGGG